jgi:colicin import membrane protein
MTKPSKLLLAVAPLLLTLACTDANKVPAESAVRAAEAAANGITDEVATLAPEQVKAFRDGLAAAKTAIAAKDYKAARAAAEPLAAKATAAIAAAAAKKEAAAKEAAAAAVKAVSDDAAAVGKRLDALKAHVASLAKTKKLPKGVTKAAVAKAKKAAEALAGDYEKLKKQVAADGAKAADAVKALGGKVADVAKSVKFE